MSHAIVPSNPHKHDEAIVRSIARDCDTSLDLARSLYEQAVDGLMAAAKIKQFVTVLAVKRVHDQLRAFKRSH